MATVDVRPDGAIAAGDRKAQRNLRELKRGELPHANQGLGGLLGAASFEQCENLRSCTQLGAERTVNEARQLRWIDTLSQIRVDQAQRTIRLASGDEPRQVQVPMLDERGLLLSSQGHGQNRGLWRTLLVEPVKHSWGLGPQQAANA